jgi:hypothetical protein
MLRTKQSQAERWGTVCTHVMRRGQRGGMTQMGTKRNWNRALALWSTIACTVEWSPPLRELNLPL